MMLFGTRVPLTALFGAAVMALFILLAIFGPWITPYPPDATVGKTWTGPSAEFWLGTDNIGRDILSRIIAGAQTTIGIALVTTVLSFTCADMPCCRAETSWSPPTTPPGPRSRRPWRRRAPASP